MISSRCFVLAICIPWCIFAKVNADGVPRSNSDAGNSVFEAKNGVRRATAELVSSSILSFAHDVGLLLNDDVQFGKTSIFSPVSIMSSMAMLLLGSKGRKYEDLRHIFGLDVPPLRDASNAFHAEFGAMMEEMQENSDALLTRNHDNWRNTNVAFNIRNKPNISEERGSAVNSVIKLVNGLFVKNGYELNPLYRDVIYSIYKCDVIPLDFNKPLARDFINDWIFKKTFGKIIGIVTENISADTNAIIASALYFKGFWVNPFIRGATVIDNFYPDGLQRTPIKVQMMATAGAHPYYFSVEHDCGILGMPYINNFTTMYIIQPKNSSRDKLSNLLKALNADKIEGMISKMVYQNVIFALPKMHLTQNIDMKNIFRALGVKNIFAKERISEEPRSDLAERTWPHVRHSITFPTDKPVNIAHAPPTSTEQLLEEWISNRNASTNLLSDLFVGDIVHKVDFVVDEDGTEGAAATVTYLKRSGGSVLFRADTPFLILVRHDPTKLPLFYGIINVPSPSF
ncbi:PREDICTED: leukocyte elastase inhibitor-like [Rhagoletis zephyria]|uniref:leukocyte elastase inhibitor-like n=1 Tax=Rhagoletis zephyria TaxID=28612 RepID=UPI000811860F|nr:PREDICTED: leukocyte elastase inhibitor-like [Rhagoletis zephyria]